MIGITSYGAYVPMWRLERKSIAKGLAGEKAIANFDEDSITMATAAVMDCLNGMNRESISELLFASTTFPYLLLQAASIVAAACDLRHDIATADFANSLRGGTAGILSGVNAVKAKTVSQAMVVAADCRLGAPGSALEQTIGDGAAALAIGDTDVAANLEASYSVSDEIMDMWRTQHDKFIRAWEPRFIAQNYMRVAGEAITGVLQKCNMKPGDFSKVVLYAPDQRRAADLARSLGFDPKAQLQDPLIGVMGNTGTAYPLMLLVAALEESKPSDLILMASYGSGADAFVFRVTEQIEKLKGKARGMKSHLASRKQLDDYRTYLLWRGLLDPSDELVYMVPYGTTSLPAMWRERNYILRFHGSRCKACNTVQFPPQRVCCQCRAKDQSEEIRLSNRGAVYTFTLDSGSSIVDSPVVDCVVDFDGGGRGEFCMTDRVPEEVEVGMRVEPSFRKLFFREGIYHYYWKVLPLRTNETGGK